MTLEEKILALEARVAALESKPVWLGGFWPKVKALPKTLWANKSAVWSVAMTGAVVWMALGQQPGCDWKPTPVPPGPTPGPGPNPPPTPKPEPAPIPLAGLRVLIVYESQDLTKMPGVANVMYSGELREYLDAKCPKGADGKTAEYRIWDKDTDAAGDALHWQDALKRKRAETPWLIVSNQGKGGFEGPLPKTVEETMAIIRKLGD